MARTIELIQKQMLDQIAADADLSTNLTSTSKRAIYRLWTFIMAVAINLHEQVIDIFSSNVEATANRAAPSTPTWWQFQVFNFQYDAVTAQIVQLINFAPQYPVIDPSLRIITRCSVTSELSGSVLIKVAKGDPAVALTTPELNALQSYINLLAPSGITCIARSSNADKLFIRATIFYSGLYSSVIKQNVILAINDYLTKLPFNGKVKISDIELTIRAVTGVTDIIIQDIVARPDSLPLSQGTALILNNATIARLWPTISGYINQEDTAGSTFDDTLIFVSE